MDVVELNRGTSPVILGLSAHRDRCAAGHLGAAERERPRCWPTPTGTSTELYDGLLPDATTVRATFHRYVIDANRDPAGASLYPGQNTTGLVPADRFRRPADLAAGRGAGRGGHRRAAGALPRALSRGAGGRDRARARRSTASPCSTTATRSARASRSCSRACCPISTSAPTTARPAIRAIEAAVAEVCAAAERLHARPQRPLQGRLDDAPLRPAGRPASTPSRWSWRRPRISTTEAPPFAYDDGKAGRLRPCPSATRSSTRASKPIARSPFRTDRGEPMMTNPTPQHPRRPRAARHRAQRQVLADRSAAAHADEQSRPRRRREPARAGRLWRHRPGGARPGTISTASSPR